MSYLVSRFGGGEDEVRAWEELDESGSGCGLRSEPESSEWLVWHIMLGQEIRSNLLELWREVWVFWGRREEWSDEFCGGYHQSSRLSGLAFHFLEGSRSSIHDSYIWKHVVMLMQTIFFFFFLATIFMKIYYTVGKTIKNNKNPIFNKHSVKINRREHIE